MPIYARSANARGEKELLVHHLQRAAELCEQFLSPIGMGNTGKLLGLYHDVGKNSEAFQEVLRRRRQHVNHAAPGAAIVLARYYKYSKDKPKIADVGYTLATVVAAHHTRLEAHDTFKLLKRVVQGEGDPRDRDDNEIPLFGQEQLLSAFTQLSGELPGMKTKPNRLPRPTEDAQELSWMLLTRLLFSGLVDADYLSSGEHKDPNHVAALTGPPLDAARALENLLALREEKRKGAKRTPLNARRDQLFEDCLAAGDMPPGIYTLTAPTGLGKTLSLMAFALRHCVTHGKRRVILVLPFLALTNQSVKDYRLVVPDLLESHSGAQLTDETRELSERWSAPCIVTTTVGFFEPLFSDSPGDCRRLHQIADSVVVLDEAQSLPAHLLDNTLLCVRELCERYGCTFVFSTATQPSFQHRRALGDRWQPREIVPDSQTLFRELTRVTWDWRLDEPTTLESLAEEVAANDQVCVIVNTRALARRLFDGIAAIRGEDDVFMMSTDLCSQHREALLKTIKRRLKKGEPCLLVSTQCIEAGVDLSFPILYRALAPLEAIIQAAGRCNRNGDDTSGRVVVFRFPEDERSYPKDDHYQRAASCVLTLNSRHPIDCADLRHIDEYYTLLYPNDVGDRPALVQAIEGLDFETVRKNYRLIEKHGVNIVVPYDRELFATLRAMADDKGLTPAFIRLARPIAVNCHMTDRDALAQVCSPIPYLDFSGRTEAASVGWYMLEDDTWYNEKKGLIQHGNVNLIQ